MFRIFFAIKRIYYQIKSLNVIPRGVMLFMQPVSETSADGNVKQLAFSGLIVYLIRNSGHINVATGVFKKIEEVIFETNVTAVRKAYVSKHGRVEYVDFIREPFIIFKLLIVIKYLFFVRKHKLRLNAGCEVKTFAHVAKF